MTFGVKSTENWIESAVQEEGRQPTAWVGGYEELPVVRFHIVSCEFSLTLSLLSLSSSLIHYFPLFSPILQKPPEETVNIFVLFPWLLIGTTYWSLISRMDHYLICVT